VPESLKSLYHWQPWVSMVWNDGSSSPAPQGHANHSTIDETDEPPSLYNNEDFLMAQEADIDESLSKTDTSGQAYLRPFSRVHLASKLNIIAAPTVCIYSIEKQKMLDWNVRMGRLSRSRRDETWARWKRGEMAKSVGFSEAVSNSPYTFALGVVALIYYLVLLYGGQKYNVSMGCKEENHKRASHRLPLLPRARQIVRYLLSVDSSDIANVADKLTDDVAAAHIEF
jgi:hypothetical protein